jgi:Icc-related predicted phosphoesterase
MAEEGSGPLGCEELAIRLATVQPLLHVFGHIHGGYGFHKKAGTTYINASVCDEAYIPVHPVLVVDLKQGKTPQVSTTPPSVRTLRKAGLSRRDVLR